MSKRIALKDSVDGRRRRPVELLALGAPHVRA